MERCRDIQFAPGASSSRKEPKNVIIRSNRDNEQENSLQPREERVRPRRRRRNMPNSEVYFSPNPPPALPEAYIQALKYFTQGQVVTELQLVMQKKMYFSDLNPNHNRLSMPIRQLRCTFLTEDETRDLEQREENGVKRMEVDAIDSLLERTKLSLRRWAMRKAKGDPSVTYVLTEKWNNIVKKSSLKELDVLQVYTVRVNRKLWFLLVKLPDDSNPELPPPNAQEPRPSIRPDIPKLLNLFPKENGPTLTPTVDDPRPSGDHKIPTLLHLFP